MWLNGFVKKTAKQNCPNAECGKYLRLLLKNFWGRWKMMFVFLVDLYIFFEIILRGELILRL